MPALRKYRETFLLERCQGLVLSKMHHVWKNWGRRAAGKEKRM